MPKKLLFMTVLLLLVSAQALTASCDLRCSFMGVSTASHALHTDMQMPHCHGMSTEQDKQVSLTATESCAFTGCGTELKAIAKNVDQNDIGSGKLLVSAVTLLVDLSGNGESNGPAALVPLRRKSDSRPFAQRPGSSLRI